MNIGNVMLANECIQTVVDIQNRTKPSYTILAGDFNETTQTTILYQMRRMPQIREACDKASLPGSFVHSKGEYRSVQLYLPAFRVRLLSTVLRSANRWAAMAASK